MEREIFYIVLAIGCFVQLAVMKICNTIFGVFKMKYQSEDAKTYIQNLSVNEIERLSNLIEKLKQK